MTQKKLYRIRTAPDSMSLTFRGVGDGDLIVACDDFRMIQGDMPAFLVRLTEEEAARYMKLDLQEVEGAL